MHLALLLLGRLLALFFGLCGVLGVMGLAGSKRAGFLYRLLISYVLLAACALYGAGAALVLRLVGRHRIAQWACARAFRVTMGLLTGVHFDVVAGAANLQTRPAVFVGNHQTALDVLLLGAIFPRYCSVTAKKQLKYMPFLGWFMAASGTVFIDRGNRQTALKAFDGAAREIREHRQSVFIFPEGTRSNTSEPALLPFKKGAFHLAVQAGVPIVPVVSACYWGVLAPSQWRFRAGRIPVVVLPPIPTHNLTGSDVDQLTIYVRDQMLRTLETLTRSSVGRQAWETHPPALKAPAHELAARERLGQDRAPVEVSEAQMELMKKLSVEKTAK